MEKSLKDIAELLDCELIGDKDVKITGLAPIEQALSGEITFVANPKYSRLIKGSAASAFIIKAGAQKSIQGKNLIISRNPGYSFAKLLTIFHEKEKEILGIDKNVFIAGHADISESVSIYPNVYIDDGATIEDGVVIYPGCFIGKNVTIGGDTTIYPNVVIKEESVIGSNVIIHAGVVIGSDGFGFVMNEGKHYKVPQVGRVVIEDDVEIGANVTIDRAAMGDTVIGEGTKIDNLVMVAHNVKIGKRCILVAQSGIAGSTKLG